MIHTILVAPIDLRFIKYLPPTPENIQKLVELLKTAEPPLDPEPGELGEWAQQLVDRAGAVHTNVDVL